MIRTIFTTILIALTLLLVSWAQESSTRNLSGFTEIEILGSIDTAINIGDSFEVLVEGSGGNLDEVQMRIVDGDTLVVEVDSGDGQFLSVTLPDLQSLILTGSGDVSLSDIDTDELRLSISGSGEVVGASITADEVDIEIMGSGGLLLQSLSADEVDMSVLGAGEVEIIEVQIDEMDAQILGAGDVSLSGQIDEVDLQITGAGDFGGEELSVESLRGNIIGAGDASFQQVEDNQLSYDEFDIGGIFDFIGAVGEHTQFEDEFEFHDDGNGGGGFADVIDELAAVLAVLLIFGGPIILIAIVFAFSYRRKKLLHETLRQYSANDQQLPDEFLEALRDQGAKRNNLHSGMILLAVGLGLGVFFLAIGAGEIAALGCIPGFIGLAMLAIWKLEKKDQNKGGDN